MPTIKNKKVKALPKGKRVARKNGVKAVKANVARRKANGRTKYGK